MAVLDETDTMLDMLRGVAGDDEEEDAISILEKVKAAASEKKEGGKGGSTSLSAAEQAKAAGEALINLNDEKNIHAAGLEDPDLKEHMEESRRVLQTRQKLTAAPSSTEETIAKLKADYANNLKQLSAVLVGLNSALKTFQTTNENEFLQATNAGKLAAGETPHSFPKEPAQALKHLQTKIANTASAHEKIHEEITEVRNKITVMRRTYEGVVDGCLVLAERLNNAKVPEATAK